jgi:hypothetical protein
MITGTPCIVEAAGDVFDNGQVQRVSNPFANSFDDYQIAEDLGANSAPTTMTRINNWRD